MSSCNTTEIEQSAEDVQEVNFTLPELKCVEEDGDNVVTKTTVNASNKIVWVATDTVGIYPNTGSQIYFSLASEAGSQSATFDGGGWAFKSTSTYYSYYPFIGDIYLDRTRIPVSFEGQAQQGTTSIEQIGGYTYLYTHGTQAASGALSFEYQYLTCVIRPKLTLNAGTYTKLALTAPDNVFVSKGYFDLTSATPAIVPEEMTNQLVVDLKGITLASQTTFTVYLVSAPVNLGGVEITVSVLDDKKKEYQCKKTPSANYAPGTIAGLTCTSWTEVPQSMGLIITDWEDGGSISGSAE